MGIAPLTGRLYELTMITAARAKRLEPPREPDHNEEEIAA